MQDGLVSVEERLPSLLTEMVVAICSLFKDSDVPRLRCTRVEPTSDYGYSTTQTTRPEPRIRLSELYQHHDRLPLFDELCQMVVNTDRLAQRILLTAQGIRTEPKGVGDAVLHGVVVPLLSTYFREVSSFEVDRQVLDSIVLRLAAEFLAPERHYVLIAPLLGLELDNELELTQRIRLRPVAFDEIQNWLWDEQWPDVEVDRDQLLHVRAALEVPYTQDRPFHTPPEPGQLAGQVVEILRVATGHPITALYEWHTACPEEVVWCSRSFGNSKPGRTSTKRTSLESQRTAFLRAWQSAQRGLTAKLSLALRRYCAALERQDLQDRVVDYWIGLESLYLDPPPMELRFRASFRIGAYLGATPEEKLSIKNRAKASYDLRCSVVHGEVVEMSPDETALVKETGEWLRRTIWHLLLDESELDLRAVDDSLLLGPQSRADV